MDINELIRLAHEDAERRRRLGIDAETISQLSRQREIVAESIKRLNNYPNFPIEDLRKRIGDVGISSKLESAREALVKSPVFDSIREANLSALRIVEGLSHNPAIEEIKKIAGTRVNEWVNFKNLHALPELPIEKFLTSHLSQITQTSVLAQNALANLELSKIGSAWQVPEEIRASFNDRFTDFSTSYKNLFKSFEVPETSIFRLPPSISELPTVEFFNGVDLLETTIDEEPEDEFGEEREIVRQEIRETAKDSIIIQLAEVNENWIPILEGARQAFNSSNPDRIRHCITSLRELVREIMQYLSPDDQIKGWSQSADDFFNNRPTRKARLRFIARNINHGAFTEFVEKDIEAILAAINIFQAGTHVAKSKLTDAQVAALIARVESAILFLFSIANYEE